MERAEWLKQMREMTEALYDHISPEYWSKFGLYENKGTRSICRSSPGGSAGAGRSCPRHAVRVGMTECSWKRVTT